MCQDSCRLYMASWLCIRPCGLAQHLRTAVGSRVDQNKTLIGWKKNWRFKTSFWCSYWIRECRRCGISPGCQSRVVYTRVFSFLSQLAFFVNSQTRPIFALGYCRRWCCLRSCLKAEDTQRGNPGTKTSKKLLNRINTYNKTISLHCTRLEAPYSAVDASFKRGARLILF